MRDSAAEPRRKLLDDMSLPVRLDEDGVAAPPRANGELAFEAPWESRLFGLTMALVETGRLDWTTFRERLIAAVEAWERRADGGARHSEAVAAGEPWDYWQRWREALEASLSAEDLVSGSEIDARADRLAARPHGHDHRHEDSHAAQP